jgi:hypothetical protein
MQGIFFRFVFLLWLTLLLCFSLIAPGYSLDVTLAWNANTEPDLAGYKLYYKTGSSGPPYNGAGAAEGDSPITLTIYDPGDPYDLDDPDNPQFTLTGLNDAEVYFFAVTAYDNKSAPAESSFSNEVATSSSPNVLTGAEVAAGCFITTAAPD